MCNGVGVVWRRKGGKGERREEEREEEGRGERGEGRGKRREGGFFVAKWFANLG